MILLLMLAVFQLPVDARLQEESLPLLSDDLEEELLFSEVIEEEEAKPGFPPLSISLFWMPVVSAKTRQDEKELVVGSRVEADLENGMGWGVSVHFQPAEYEGKSAFSGTRLGILLMSALHEEESAGTHARTYSLYFEVSHFWTNATRRSEWFAYGGFALGAGFVLIDFGDTFDDTGGSSAEARLVAGAMWNGVSLEVSGGFFYWGYPSETVGDGSFLTLGIRVGI